MPILPPRLALRPVPNLPGVLRRLAAAVGLAVAAGPALSQEVTTYTLDNGLDVVVIEDHRAPVVVHMIWYRAGSADEPVGASGAAHFLEHLLFKGTETHEAGEFRALISSIGGTENAFTNYDYTAYFQRVAADRLGEMMEFEADRMNNLLLTDEDIATERQVIIEERNQRTESSPGRLAGEQVMAAQFLNHRYGVPIIGWMHEMQTLSREDTRDFYDRYYAPNNATLVVAGDVLPEDVLALAERHYGPLAREDVPERIRSQEPPQRAPRRLVFEDERVSQDYVYRTYLAPERDPDDQTEAAALVYLAELLGGSSFTSLFSERLVFDQEIALFTGASYDGDTLDDTTFSVNIGPVPGVGLTEAEAALDAAIAEFLETGADPAKMESIRTQLRASEIYARDSAQGLANRYGMLMSLGFTVDEIQAWPDVLQAVTAEDVNEAARRLFDPDRSVTIWVVADEDTTAEGVAQ